MYTDLRKWLQELEPYGEVKHISGVDCHLEISALSEIAAREAEKPLPVLLFDDIPGFPKGFRILLGLLGSPRRVAKTLGLPEADTDRMKMLNSWRKKVKDLKYIPPRYVSSAPIQQNVDTGERVDLLKFPVPFLHEQDGGRYFGTGHGVIEKDPDSGYINIGTYRSMLVDRDHLALHILEGQHGSVIMNKKYFERGQKMPVAIAVGMEPPLFFASFNHGVPWGTSEYDYAGGLKGEPVEVIKGEYTGLPLPAHAEIVIEGEVDPQKRVDEGPFGEWHGYYANLGLKSVPEPVIEVKAVYYRNDPILTCQPPMMPGLDMVNLPMALCNSDGIWKRLESNSIPGIKGVWCYSETVGDALLVVVSIEQSYPGHSREVGYIASQYAHMNRYTIVVEDDIDPSNIKQVLWAMMTRGKPHEAIQILNHCRSNSADPTIPPEEKRKYKTPPKPLHNSRVVIDACRPLEWKDDWYPVSVVSPELRAKTVNKWRGVLDELRARK